MKITKTQLKQIIKEELDEAIERMAPSSARGMNDIIPTDVANMVLNRNGRFILDVELPNGEELSVDGQLHEDSLAELLDILTLDRR